jgi:hypothetical protein
MTPTVRMIHNAALCQRFARMERRSVLMTELPFDL